MNEKGGEKFVIEFSTVGHWERSLRVKYIV